MPKETIAQLAKRYGITARHLARLKKAGVDIHDERAVYDFRNQHGRPDSVDYAAERAAKTRAERQLVEHKLDVLRRNHVPVSEVREDLLRIGSAIKAQMLRLEVDLPPVLEGLTAAQMQARIREKADLILSLWSDATSEIYAEPITDDE